MLELKNISYIVEGDKEILEDVNLTINDKFVAITGPNGSGKSTLAKLIAGIIHPTAGRIILDGEDITDLNITERANKGISYAFQQPVHFKGLKVKDLISVASGRTMSVKEICDRAFRGRTLCQRLCEPGVKRQPFRRRAQEDRDCYDPRQSDETVCV